MIDARDLQYAVNRWFETGIISGEQAKKIVAFETKPLRLVTPGDKPPPTLRERIVAVAGTDEFTIPQLIDRLGGRGWLPMSTDLPAYLSLVLSTNGDIFKRLKLGCYRVKQAG